MPKKLNKVKLKILTLIREKIFYGNWKTLITWHDTSEKAKAAAAATYPLMFHQENS